MVKAIYNLLLCLLAILFLPVGLVLALFQEKRRATLGPRLGFQQVPPLNKPVWVHGLSVGEINAAIPLVLALAQAHPEKDLVVSASTKTGFDLATAQLHGKVAAVIYYPYDLAWSVIRALKQVDPCLCILVESDIWPNFVFQVKKQGIPLVLANGRLSDSSYKGYKKLGFLFAPVYKSFDKVGAQSEQEGDRFLNVGVRPQCLEITGNLKFDRPPPPALAPLEILPEFPGPVLVAGSTHPGEETILARLLKGWKSKHGLSLIVAPRDPKRSRAVLEEFSKAGFSTTLYSQAAEKADVVVVDQMGVLAALYARGDLCFIGGSLRPYGGHNPLEPAVYGKPIIFGPDMKDFPHISMLLLEKGGALQVQDPEGLEQAVEDLLTNPTKAARLGKIALEVIRQNQGALEKNLALVKEYIREPQNNHG
ncbi:MAG: 3-deoxy-D-manno-octulosonic acid transferase [Desulfatibacillum sp.]|nr:3-deoxy-D-manno-octulosonic acid transferase [Desulfatibacillum sp.]